MTAALVVLLGLSAPLRAPDLQVEAATTGGVELPELADAVRGRWWQVAPGLCCVVHPADHAFSAPESKFTKQSKGTAAWK